MKKLFYLSLAVIFIISACSKDETNNSGTGTVLSKITSSSGSKRIYSYNSNGKVSKIDFISSGGANNGYYEYTYNTAGKVDKIYSYDNSNVKIGEFTYNWDANNKLISRDIKKLINGSLRLTSLFNYEISTDMKKVKEYEFDSTDFLRFYREYTMDAMGNNTETRWYGNDSTLRATFFYTFDTKNEPLYNFWKDLGMSFMYNKNNIVGITTDLTPTNGEVTFFVNPNLSYTIYLFNSVYEYNADNYATKETTNYLNGTSDITLYEYK